jgi:hypothetical protein
MALEILDAVGERLNTMSIGESCMTSHTRLIPSAKAQPGTVRAGVVAVGAVAFPTVVFEVAHRHESWAVCSSKMLASEKALFRRTSVPLFAGVKLFPHEFKVFWARRARPGHSMKVMRMTEKI